MLAAVCILRVHTHTHTHMKNGMHKTVTLKLLIKQHHLEDENKSCSFSPKASLGVDNTLILSAKPPES